MKNYFLILFTLILFTFCGVSKNKNVLKIGVPLEAVSLYPYGPNTSSSARVYVQIFDRLIEKDSNGKLQPSLALSWKYISPTTLELKLRPNVFFHNGELFTAKDVKFSVEQMIKSPEVSMIVAPIKNIQIVDNLTIRMVLKKPFAPLLSHLAHSSFSIVNQKAMETMEDIPIGTGPYRFTEWSRGQKIVLNRNTNYWLEPAKIEQVEFQTIEDPAARTIALEAGDIDIAYDIEGQDRIRIQEEVKNVELIEAPVARMEYLGINIGKAKNSIWTNVLVRQAIAYAIDTEGIINSVLFGAGIPADSILSPKVEGYANSGMEKRQYDPEKARELLKQANVPKNIQVSLWTRGGYTQKMAEIIQANLREIGINIQIETYEWGRFISGTAKGEQELYILSWTAVTGDADYGLYNLVHSTTWGSGGNYSFYANPILDQYLDKAREELNSKTRNLLYKKAQEIVYDELPIIPLFYRLGNVAINKNTVKGFIYNPTDIHLVKSIYFDGTQL